MTTDSTVGLAPTGTSRARFGPPMPHLLRSAALALAALALVVIADVGELLLFAALAVGVVSLILRPQWGVLAMSASWMLGVDPLRVGPVGTVEFLAALLLIPLGMHIAYERRIALLTVPEVWVLFAIGMVLVAATAWSMLMHPPPPHAAYEYAVTEFRYFAKNLTIFAFFVAFIRTPRDILIAVAVFLLLILVFAFDALQLLQGGPDEVRAQSMGIADQNRLGALCVWGTALFWSLRHHSNDRRWRLLGVLPLLGLPFVALLTASRSALLQLLLLAGLVLAQQRGWSPARRAKSVVLLLMATALIVVAVPSSLLLRATSFGTGTDDIAADSTRNRSRALRDGLIMAAEHPFLGVGPGNYRWRRGKDTGPHNSYIWALTSGGPALLILYLLLVHRAYRGAAAAERSGPPQLVWVAKGLRLCLIELVLFSVSADIWLQQPMYFLVGLSVALRRHATALTATALVPAGDTRVGLAIPRAV